jgi:hypothetical protein
LASINIHRASQGGGTPGLRDAAETEKTLFPVEIRQKTTIDEAKTQLFFRGKISWFLERFILFI